MKIGISLWVLSFLLCAFTPVKQYSIGDVVADFKLKNVDSKMVSLNDYKKEKGVVIVFTCNHCPYAKKYQQRVNQLNQRYSRKGFPVIAISPNDPAIVPEDDFAEMVKRAKEENYSYPYLIDETQEIAKAFNATKTPHAFVLQNENDTWVLKYAGAIDDNVEDAAKVTHRYVEEAINAINTGKAVETPTTKSVGCGIKWRVAAK